jgi:hypothetical protein
MRQLRISLLKKIAQDLFSMREGEGSAKEITLLEQIMSELGKDLPPPPGGSFEITAEQLQGIEQIQGARPEELRQVERMLKLLEGAGVDSPEKGRAITGDITRDVHNNLPMISASLNAESSINSSQIFENLFRTKLKKLADHNAVDAICDDLKTSGAFRLYEGELISKKASSGDFLIKENISILNSKIEQYQHLEKSAQIFDWSKIKNISGDAAKGAISALSNAGTSIMSGAWSLIKSLGKGFLRILPFIAIIWDVWDLINHGYSALKVWTSEFSKYGSYGEPAKLADISYLETLYSENKSDLNKVLDIAKIINLSQSFDENWVLSISSLILVIEDIVTFFLNLTGVGMIIDFLLSAGIYFGAKSYASSRSVRFEDLKDLIAVDVKGRHEKLVGNNGADLLNMPDLFPSIRKDLDI